MTSCLESNDQTGNDAQLRNATGNASPLVQNATALSSRPLVFFQWCGAVKGIGIRIRLHDKSPEALDPAGPMCEARVARHNDDGRL